MRTIANRRAERLSAPPAPAGAASEAQSTYSLTLSSLQDCVVDLLPEHENGADRAAAVTAVYAEDLERTVILLPRDLKGSIMLSRLRRCIVVAGCQQVSKHSDIEVCRLTSASAVPHT